MTFSKNHFIRILLFLIVLGGCKKNLPDKAGNCSFDRSYDHPQEQAFQRILDRYVDKGLPGITVLVRNSKGTWVGSAGKADIEGNIRMKPCHVSKVASITKMMVGTLTLILVEQGKIDLDNRISRYLKDETLEDIANGEKATVCQLMNHTSGIYDIVSDEEFYLEILDDPDQEWTAEKLLEYVRGDEAYFSPGKDEHYSNTNFLLLSLIIEEATGREHHSLLREKLIEPLGLEGTYYDPHNDLPSQKAHGYFDLYNEGTITDLTQYSTGNGNGYTGIFSTVTDLKEFVEALYRDRTLLADSTMNEMLTFTPTQDDGKSFGLACYKDFLDRPPNEYAFGHRGRDLAYTAGAYYFPKKDVTLTLLVNYGTNGKSFLHDTFHSFRKAIADEALKE